MSRVDAEFKTRVYALVARIPKGRVMTYGQIAALCGAAWAAWEVGQIAHWASCLCGRSCRPGLDGVQGNGEKRTEPYAKYGEGVSEPVTQQSAQSTGGVTGSASKQMRAACPAGLPWQRVVNKQGGLASAYTWGGLAGHKRALEADGVEVDENYRVSVEDLLWQPASP